MTETRAHSASATPAERLIRERIALEGPMPFARFVDLALYHPTYGYYNQPGEKRGRAGDYFTSLQVSRLFPEILADAVGSLHEALGSDQFALVEVGSGNGELIEGILDVLTKSGRAKGLRVWAVERSRPARERLWRRLSRFPRAQVVSSLDDIDWMGGLEGCVISNELFDALPFHRVRRRGGEWREIFVAMEGDTLVETEGPLSDPHLMERGGWSRLDVPEGHEVEVRPAAEILWEEWDALFHRGYVLTIDYGHPKPALIHPLRRNGTWRCFFRHEANETPLERIGRQDITAHVDFTDLVEGGQRVQFDPLLFCSQGIFLSHVGQARLERFLFEASESERPSRVGQVQQLVHPDAMGAAFSVLIQGKNAPLPESWSEIPNRTQRLKI